VSAKLKNGHRVRLKDRPHIQCQKDGCQNQAVWCSYSRFGTPPNNSIAFYYFCKEHK